MNPFTFPNRTELVDWLPLPFNRDENRPPKMAGGGHRDFAPELAYGRHRGPHDSTVRSASVALLLCPSEQGWLIPLTRRHSGLADHAGQISFPGGRIDPDENEWESAVRELEEELGVPREQVVSIGRLDPIYIYSSNYLVHPFVASISTMPKFKPNRSEVDEVLFFPVDPAVAKPLAEVRTLHRRGVEIRTPGYRLGSHFVWGATGMVLASFLELVDERRYRSR